MPVTAVIVENGTGVANANSYATRAELIQYALDQGVTLPNDTTTDVLLYKAMTYLETFRAQYVGTIEDKEQPLAWPRTDVVISGEDWDDGVIPVNLKRAQMQLAIYAQSADLMPVVTGAFVIKEKVGPIETEYASAVRTNGQPYFPLIDSMLSELLTVVSSFTLRTVRA